MVAEGTEVVVRAVGALPARRDSQLHRGPSHPSSASLGFAALRAQGCKNADICETKRKSEKTATEPQTDIPKTTNSAACASAASSSSAPPPAPPPAAAASADGCVRRSGWAP